MVFNNGTPQGLNVWIPIGGQADPSSTLGDNLAWKKAQKNERKKKTSEVINKSIPQRNPVTTIFVCNPCNVPSREISRHQKKATVVRLNNLSKRRPNLVVWNHVARPAVSPSLKTADNKGQGDSSTRWKGWGIKFDNFLGGGVKAVYFHCLIKKKCFYY